MTAAPRSDVASIGGRTDHHRSSPTRGLREPAGACDLVVTSGGGSETPCQKIREGTFGMVISFDARAQGAAINTQIASLLFAKHGCGPVMGVAPECRGLIIPVFRDHPLVAGAVLPSSQSDLARAIDLARDHGAMSQRR